jgi:hypothetical protein
MSTAERARSGLVQRAFRQRHTRRAEVGPLQSQLDPGMPRWAANARTSA